MRMSESRGHSDREWLVPMAAITAVQFALWWGAWAAGIASPPLIIQYNAVAVIGLALALVPFFLRYLFVIRREGETHPFRRIAADFSWPRAMAVAMALLLGSLAAGAFSAMKAALPLAVPFYLDGPLTRLERTIFGTDPWRISHALLGWATPLIDRFYLSWLPVMLIAFNLVLLSRPAPRKTRSLIAYVLMWPAVGTLGSYLFSSAGPIFTDRELLRSLRGADGTLLAYQHLWSAYAHRYETLGGGISAMPSMHIAMACWLALTLRQTRFQWAGWTYLALIWVGSIHLGWHYALDGVGGIIGALAVWKIAPKLAYTPQPRLSLA